MVTLTHTFPSVVHQKETHCPNFPKTLHDTASPPPADTTPALLALQARIDGSRAYNRSYIQKGYMKAIISSPLDLTPEPHIAVLILEGYSVAISASKQHEAVSIGMPDPKWPDNPNQQEIYCDSPYFPFPEGVYPEYLVMRYLAESNGRLLMIRRWMSIPPKARLGDHDRTLRFEVFVADLTTVSGWWVKVDSLDGQALFLGSECSKSVFASQCADGIEEDCIYFMHKVFDNPCREHRGPCVDPLGDSGVSNMKNGSIKPLVPEAVMVELKCKRQFLTCLKDALERAPVSSDRVCTQTPESNTNILNVQTSILKASEKIKANGKWKHKAAKPLGLFKAHKNGHTHKPIPISPSEKLTVPTSPKPYTRHGVPAAGRHDAGAPCSPGTDPAPLAL
ncbi:hypothetical protein EJB05_49972, partial [Eragrostis curvula]